MSTKLNFENHPGYEKLKEAFRLSNKDFLGSIELVPEENVCFSSRYEKKMVRPIKRQKRPYWKFVNTVGKKIAVIAIAFMMLFGLSMTIKAVREPVISFIENVFEKFSELFVNKSETQNAPDKIEEVYTFEKIPEGFEETRCLESEVYIQTFWENGKTTISLSQGILSTKTTFDNEKTDIIKVIINGVEVFYTNNKNTTQIFWNNNEYVFEVFYGADISIDEMIILYNSVIKK